LTKLGFVWSRNLYKNPFTPILAQNESRGGNSVKKFESIITLFLAVSLTFLALSCTVQFEVRADEQVMFEDDFESYEVGTFPTSGGWEMWYSGNGSEYQVIVNNVSSSPTKSLQLLGMQGWAAYAAKPIETDSPLIGFNASVRVDKLGNGTRDIARLGFATIVPPFHATSYAPILFKDNGTIQVMEEPVLQSYVAGRWYKVTVIMDRNAETYSLWVDDVLLGENFPVMTNNGEMTTEETSWKIEAFGISQNYYTSTVYFDEVVVFSAFEADPKLELEPTSGIAATTLVGSGFAPNSEISVTWNNITVHTVPSPLLSDGYGNFTAIISVLNQTVPGSYEVRAVDEMGYEANATFEVVSACATSTLNETGTVNFDANSVLKSEIVTAMTWPSLLVIVPAVLVVTVGYRRKTQTKPKEKLK
jgi:hypothetical protein